MRRWQGVSVSEKNGALAEERLPCLGASIEAGGAPEKRWCPDGNWYTQAEFVAFYGDLVEWDRAGIVAALSAAGPHNTEQMLARCREALARSPVLGSELQDTIPLPPGLAAALGLTPKRGAPGGSLPG